MAGAFLVAAIASAWLPEHVRRGIWLPLHLALAGAATEAICAAMPFFTAALLAAPPASGGARLLALTLPGVGALGIAIGVPARLTWLATAGGVSFVAGVGTLAWVAFVPALEASRLRHRWVLVAYAVALADIGAGATLATLYVGRFAPVVAAWATLLPAHAWLNLLGFVSLVIAGTLLHLFPTVVGARLRYGWPVPVLVVGLGVGPPAVALGYVLHWAILVRLGALCAVAGAGSLAACAALAWRSRGRWTGDLPWRRVVIGQLAAGIGWFAVAVVVAAARSLAWGADPAGWAVTWLIAPLAVGWMAQSLLAAWAHLLPAVSGGSPQRHARQRHILGRAPAVQVALINVGTLLLAIGLPVDSTPALLTGMTAASAGLLFGLEGAAEASVRRAPAPTP